MPADLSPADDSRRSPSIPAGGPAADAGRRPMIEIRNLFKSFGSNQVLRGVSLTVGEGSTTVILGGSGSGKTVLMKHMIGLLRPDAGEVIIDGERFDNLPEAERQRVRQKFGMVFQQAALFDSMTIFENVAFPLREHAHLPAEKLQQVVFEKLDQVGLRSKADNYPDELSGGQRKRIGLARALALDPKIVLYDEPTTGLDPITTDNVDQMVIDAKQQYGVTSVIISHDIGSAFKVADHLMVLYQGVILADGPPEVVRGSQDPFVKKFFSLWFDRQ
jgi:phospholipid/cholesterol/gamma-HCH transport system ATP-binding protein